MTPCLSVCLYLTARTMTCHVSLILHINDGDEEDCKSASFSLSFCLLLFCFSLPLSFQLKRYKIERKNWRIRRDTALKDEQMQIASGANTASPTPLALSLSGVGDRNGLEESFLQNIPHDSSNAVEMDPSPSGEDSRVFAGSQEHADSSPSSSEAHSSSTPLSPEEVEVREIMLQVKYVSISQVNEREGAPKCKLTNNKSRRVKEKQARCFVTLDTFSFPLFSSAQVEGLMQCLWHFQFWVRLFVSFFLLPLISPSLYPPLYIVYICMRR